jgi:signal peptidase II
MELPKKTVGTLPEKINPAKVWLAHHFSAYRLFWLVAGITLTLDQITKLLVWLSLPETYAHAYGGVIEVLPIFNLVHVYNKGAAFSILSGYGWLLILLAIAAISAIFFWRRHLELEKPFVQLAFGMLVGGIVGNVVDRLLRGEVIDFLDFHWNDLHWPAFNVADCGICVGVGIYFLRSFATPQTPSSSPSEKDAVSSKAFGTKTERK